MERKYFWQYSEKELTEMPIEQYRAIVKGIAFGFKDSLLENEEIQHGNTTTEGQNSKVLDITSPEFLRET